MITVNVVAGDTLSGIASAHGVSLSAIEAANPSITNPNLIYVGQQVAVPVGGSLTQWTPSAGSASPTPSSSPLSSSLTSTSTTSSGGLSDVPGVPSAFAACVAYRESSDLQNPAANGNAYGIIPASGYNVAGDSLAQQKVVFREIYDSAGPIAWEADGCSQHLFDIGDWSADESSNNGPWG